jgi:hypothetical protein
VGVCAGAVVGVVVGAVDGAGVVGWVVGAGGTIPAKRAILEKVAIVMVAVWPAVSMVVPTFTHFWVASSQDARTKSGSLDPAGRVAAS